MDTLRSFKRWCQGCVQTNVQNSIGPTRRNSQLYRQYSWLSLLSLKNIHDHMAHTLSAQELVGVYLKLIVTSFSFNIFYFVILYLLNILYFYLQLLTTDLAWCGYRQVPFPKPSQCLSLVGFNDAFNTVRLYKRQGCVTDSCRVGESQD